MLSAERKITFRPGRRVISCLILLATSLCVPQAAFSASTEKQAKQWVMGYIHQVAAQQGWQRLSAQPTLSFFQGGDRPMSCESPLTFSVPMHNAPLTRFPLLVRCTAPSGQWQLRGEVTARLSVQAVTPREDLVAGSIIDSRDIRMTQIQLEPGQRTDIVVRPEDVLQMAARRTLSAGQPLLLSQLKAPVLIHRNQPVTLVLDQLGLGLSTSGTALQNGIKGAVIRVKNDSSGRVVAARVISDQQVMVTATE